MCVLPMLHLPFVAAPAQSGQKHFHPQGTHQSAQRSHLDHDKKQKKSATQLWEEKSYWKEVNRAKYTGPLI